MPAFQAVFSCTPDLVNLDLYDALASTSNFISSVEFDALQRLDLPRLSQLLVNAPLSTTIALLSSVNIPVHAQIRLGLSHSEEHPSHDSYDQFNSVAAQHYSRDCVSSLPMVHSVVIKLDSFMIQCCSCSVLPLNVIAPLLSPTIGSQIFSWRSLLAQAFAYRIPHHRNISTWLIPGSPPAPSTVSASSCASLSPNARASVAGRLTTLGVPLDDAVGFGALLGGNDDLGAGGDDKPSKSIVLFLLVDIKCQEAISRRDNAYTFGARLPALN